MAPMESDRSSKAAAALLARHNRNKSGGFDFHEQLADDWAERLYAAHCDAWAQQNRSVSPAFIRAIRDRPTTGVSLHSSEEKFMTPKLVPTAGGPDFVPKPMPEPDPQPPEPDPTPEPGPVPPMPEPVPA